jgi:hypothetical protein
MDNGGDRDVARQAANLAGAILCAHERVVRPFPGKLRARPGIVPGGASSPLW